MRLDLTLQETEKLRHSLTQALAFHESDADDQVLKNLLEKVIAAEAHSTHHCRCPVCQQLFNQEALGRTGVYCSPACKQKAYRQRRNAWRKRVGLNASR